MADIAKLTAAYEKALQAHYADRDDEQKHAASVEAAERLATARTRQREVDVAAGARSPGVSVVTDAAWLDSQGGGE